MMSATQIYQSPNGLRSPAEGARQADVGARQAEPLPADHASGASSAGGKILLVDDSPTELAVLSALFQNEGFEVITARDGVDALDKLGRERPRAILLDVVMPGKNGFSLCRQIRADAQFAQTPIILVTSKNQASDRFWGLKQGATDYVTKPWDPADLVETVRRYL